MCVARLKFSESSRTVHVGEKSVRLSPKQFAVLRHVHEHGPTDFEDIQDAIWRREGVSDGAIRAVCAKVNAKLLEGGFDVELSTHRSRVSIAGIG